MNLDEGVRERIESIIASDKVVLFMKGTRQLPQCGFSAATVNILDSLVSNYTTVNVLEDQAIRDGVKAYSNWPTIPQLYANREFVGGCDIVKQLFNTGDLHETLGLPAPDRTPPDITISDAAAQVIRATLQSHPGQAVHLSIDTRWEHKFSLGPEEGHEIKAVSNDLEVLMDLATAAKANGLVVDMTESLAGSGLAIDNPNAPPTGHTIGT